jgi:hypothetical protein
LEITSESTSTPSQSKITSSCMRPSTLRPIREVRWCWRATASRRSRLTRTSVTVEDHELRDRLCASGLDLRDGVFELRTQLSASLRRLTEPLDLNGRDAGSLREQRKRVSGALGTALCRLELVGELSCAWLELSTGRADAAGLRGLGVQYVGDRDGV